MARCLFSLVGLVCAVVFGAVTASATTYTVSTTGSDSNAGTSAAPFATIQKAASIAIAGDTISVAAGDYAGARFSTSGTSALPILVHGEPGAVVSRPGPQNSNGDNLWIRDASYIEIEGFEVHSAPRAGIAVQAEPDAECHGVVIRENFSHDNGRWGIFSGYAEGVVIVGNETSFSADEHGIYVSNSADNPVIEANVSHDNHDSGIQINADPAEDGDGIITNARVEGNTIYANGTGGGAAINLASVVSSRIVNNLIYDNHATGIAGWDDGDGNQFGSHDNRIYNNTIVQAADGRFAISFLDGSVRNSVENNILLHTGDRGSIEIDPSSEAGLVSDFNVIVDRFSVNDEFITAGEWRALGHDSHSIMATTADLFVDSGAANYFLKLGSPAIDAGTSVPGVTTDIDLAPRPQGATFDIGAYEFGTATTANFSIAADAPTVTVARRESGQIVLTITRTGSFAGAVTVTAPNTQAFKIKLTPPSVSTSGDTVTFDFKIKKKAPRATHDLVFTASGGGLTRSATVSVTVQ